MKKILVLCTGNSCRSQMAHGYLEKFGGEDWMVSSAGVETHGVNPFAVGIMFEDGVNITHHTSNHVDDYKDIDFDIMFSVCDHAKEQCPVYFGNAHKIHHSFPDPAGAKGGTKEVMRVFREVRDDIKVFCKNIIDKNS